MAGDELPDEDVCRDAGVLSAEQVVARFIGLAAGKGGYETTCAQRHEADRQAPPWEL